MYGVRDSVKGLRAPQSLCFIEQAYCMENEIHSLRFHSQTSLMYGVRDSSVAPSSRDSIGMTGFVVGGVSKKVLKRSFSTFFYNDFYYLIVIPNSDKIEDFRQ